MLTLQASGSKAKAVVAAFVSALTDKDVLVRSSAADSLAKVGLEGKAAIPALLKSIVDKDYWVRASAAHALVAIDIAAAELAIPALIETLKDINETERYRATADLGQLGVCAKNAIPGLIIALTDKEWNVSMVPPWRWEKWAVKPSQPFQNW